MEIDICTALQSKWLGTQWVCNGKTIDDITWLESNTVPKPTQEEIDTEVKSLQAEYDAQEYARKRQAEYPDWGTQLNKIYDDGLTKWKTEMVDPIKAKYPKP